TAFRNCLINGGVIPSSAASCLASQLTAIDNLALATPGLQALSGIALWAQLGWQCEAAGTLSAALGESQQARGFLSQAIGGPGGELPFGCGTVLTPLWSDTTT